MIANFLAVGPNGVHLAGDILEVYWGSAAFAVLFAIFLWKGLPVVLKSMKGRTERIRTELNEAQTARVDAQSALTSASSDLPDVGQERLRIRREAIETADKVKADLVAKAHQEAKDTVAKAEQDCVNMKRQANADLQSQASLATAETTEAIVLGGMDANTQTQLIDSYIDRVGQLT